MTERPIRGSAEPVEVRHLGVVDYQTAYDLQHGLATETVGDRAPDDGRVDGAGGQLLTGLFDGVRT